MEAGELNEEEADELRALLAPTGATEPESGYPTDDDLADYLSRQGIPSREDILRLNEQLDELVDKLDDISPDAEAA